MCWIKPSESLPEEGDEIETIMYSGNEYEGVVVRERSSIGSLLYVYAGRFGQFSFDMVVFWRPNELRTTKLSCSNGIR